jgi:hypothetical protein
MAGDLLGHGHAPFPRPLGHANRRQAHHIPGVHPRLSTGPPLVDPHLAAADDAVNVGLGNALELAHQVVVQPLSNAIFIDGQQFDLRQLGEWDCPL